jgi:hypothetical protein
MDTEHEAKVKLKQLDFLVFMALLDLIKDFPYY